MAESLKVGLAGVGTVGTAVIQLLEHERDKLLARCGRPIEVVAVTARSRSKKRAVDLKKLRWAADPLELAALASEKLDHGRADSAQSGKTDFQRLGHGRR